MMSWVEVFPLDQAALVFERMMAAQVHFSAPPVEQEIKLMLDIPAYMKIAFAVRLGYPIITPAKYLRVRRDVEEFTHQNLFGNKGLD
jgi:hypothetical protein